MSDSVNGIVIQITDGIDSSIPSKIAAIGAAARESDTALKSLQVTLNSINASGLTGLKADIAATSGATQQLSASLKQATISNRDLASSSQQVSSSNQNTSASTLRSAQLTLELSTARRALNTATKNLSNAEKELSASAASGNAKAAGIIASYKAQQLAAADQVASLRAARTEANTFTKSQTAVGAAAHGTVTPVMAASGAIRVLEGNFGTNVRAGERFLVTTLKLGPALQAAFPLIGAAALVGIFFILAEHIDKLIERFRKLGTAAQNFRLEMLRLHQEELKGEHGPGATGFNFLVGRENAPDIRTGEVSHNISEINRQLRLVEVQNQINEAGKKGLELQRAKEKSVQNEITATERGLAQAKLLQGAATIPLNGVQAIPPSIFQRFNNLSTQAGKHEGPLGLFRAFGNTPLNVQSAIPTDSEQFKELEQQSKQYGSSVDELTLKIEELKAKQQELKLNEPFAALKDQTKAARLQLQQFKETLATLKLNKDGVVTPGDELEAIRQFKATHTILPQNQAEIDNREGTAKQAVERQGQVLELLAERYKDARDAIGLYSEAKKVEQAISKIDLELKRNLIDTESSEANAIKDNARYVIEHATYQRELEKIYKEFNGPLKDYNEGIQAANDLEADGVITHRQAMEAINRLKRAYQDSVNPINEFEISLDHQTGLLDKYGVALKVATEIDSLRRSLQKEGKDLDQQQIVQLTQRLRGMEQERLVQTELNALYDKTVGAKDKLLATQKALDKGLTDEIITLKNYRLATLAVNLALNELANNSGSGKFTRHVVQILGGLVDTSRSVTKKLDDVWTGFFKTLEDGFADSIGRALVYNEDLKQALLDTARQAVAGLISELIKLSIELLLINSLEKVFPKLKTLLDSKPQDTVAQTAKNTAAAVASIAAISTAEYLAIEALQEPAWALAEAVSLISFGANAVGAVAGIESVVQAGASAMSGVLHLASGIDRVPGIGSGDTVPSLLTPGEAVLTAMAADSIGRSNIRALNAGARGIQGSVGRGGGPIVNVIHDGSTRIVVEKTSESEIRLIAQQESKSAVEKHAPRVIEADLQDANSRTSRALRTNTTAKRQR